MRQNVSTGDIPFRKTYIRLVVDRIKVDDGIVRVIGDKPRSNGQSLGVRCSQFCTQMALPRGLEPLFSP